MNANAAAALPRALDEVLPGVQHRFLRTGPRCECSLLWSRYRADDVGAAQSRDLAEQKADPTRRRMDQAVTLVRQRVRRDGEIMGGHALQHERGAHIIGDRIG